MSNLKIVNFPIPDYREPVKALRNLADDIEAGNHGEVNSCGVVIFGETMEVFGSGVDNEGTTIALLFSAAAHRFAREIEEQGR